MIDFLITIELARLKKRLTIHYIAGPVNLSATADGLAFTGKVEHRIIMAAVQEKVPECVAEVGCRTNRMVLCLRARKSMIVNVLVDDILEPLFIAIATALTTDKSLYKPAGKTFHFSTNINKAGAKTPQSIVSSFPVQKLKIYANST